MSSASKDNFFDVITHQFQFQITATLTFSQGNRTRRGIPLYNPFADYTNHLNTITTTVPALSRHPLASLKLSETYSVGGANNNPFQTTTTLNPTEIHPKRYINQTLLLKWVPSQVYLHYLLFLL